MDCQRERKKEAMSSLRFGFSGSSSVSFEELLDELEPLLDVPLDSPVRSSKS